MKRRSRALLVWVLFLAVGNSSCSAPQLPTSASKPTKSSTDRPSEPRPAHGEGTPSTRLREQEGPYHDLLTLEPSQVEKRLGKPTKVESSGNLTRHFHWLYEELGLVLSISTNGYTGRPFVSTMYQRKGRIMDSLVVGDSEERVKLIAGPVITTMTGERIAQFVHQDVVFTVTIEEGRVVHARMEPVGRPD